MVEKNKNKYFWLGNKKSDSTKNKNIRDFENVFWDFETLKILRFWDLRFWKNNFRFWDVQNFRFGKKMYIWLYLQKYVLHQYLLISKNMDLILFPSSLHYLETFTLFWTYLYCYLYFNIISGYFILIYMRVYYFLMRFVLLYMYFA